MFKKGPDIDKKKLLLKASDVKKDSLTRLKHFKTLIEHLDFNELPLLFKSHFSFIYHTFIDTFSTFDCNSKQRRDDLDCILFMLEKILIYNPDLIKKRWQFYSITFVMQKLLHQSNTWRLRQEGVRLFVLWYSILCDETNPELQTMFGSLVPNIVPTKSNNQQLSPTNNIPVSISNTNPQLHQHSIQTAGTPQLPIKLCSIDPLVPRTVNEQLPNDEISFYLDSLLQFMVTQLAKPFWGNLDEARKNQELSFSFLFTMFKRVYLQHLFPNFNSSLIADSKPYFSNYSVQQYVDEAVDTYIKTNQTNEEAVVSASSPRAKRDLQIDLKQTHYLTSPVSQSSSENDRQITLSLYQSIVIRWLTRILRQDMIPGQDELIKPGGSGERRDFQSGFRDTSSGQLHDQEFSGISEGNSTAIFQNMDTTSREMEIARKVIGTWPENIVVIHELFRKAFLNYFQPASMKRVVNVYKEWICNGGPNQTATPLKTTRLGYTSFGDLLQVFVLNSSNAFVTKVHNPAMLDEQVEMCKRIMNIYRYMVMKIYMNSATWEQLLNVMLSITERLFPTTPPERKEITIGGRIAPAFFQTFIVSWIRANLYVHITNQMWHEFHRVMKNLICWRELIEEWSTTMSSLTRVLVKHVYGLSLTDLPLDKPIDRRRRPKISTVGSTSKSIDQKSPGGVTSVVAKSCDTSTRESRSESIRLAKELFCKGLTRSNSDGFLLSMHKKLYSSSLKLENAVNTNCRLRKIQSEYLILRGTGSHSSRGFRSNSPTHNDVIDGGSLKDPNMIIDSDQVIESHQSSKSESSSRASKKPEQRSSSDRCVLLGGTVRGWTPENSVIMWRRMLGLFGNINQIEDPDNHLVAMRCLAVISCDFLKIRENLGVSLDNQSTPERPNLIPPYTYHAGWLLEATHLAGQFKESRLTAYKLLCLMSIRRHDVELSPQYYASFYESLYRGLTSSDPHVQASIIKNSTQLLSLELPGCTFLVQSFYERCRSILLNASKELTTESNPRDQAIQILHAILALHRPFKKLMVLKPETNNHLSLSTPSDLKAKIFETFLACNMRPIMLDSLTRSKSLCAMAVHVYQELCDKSDSLDLEKLFDTLLTELQDSNNLNLFRMNCDLLRLFAEHATFLSQSKAALVSSVVQIVCQLIVRLSTNENNKEAIQCLIICLEDWCISLGKSHLLRPVDQLSSDDDDTLSNCLNDSLITIVLRSLESVVNGEQYSDEPGNRGNRSYTAASKNSDAHSSGHHSNSDNGYSGARDRDRTITAEQQRSTQQSKQIDECKSENENTKAVSLACKVAHQKILTYLGHFPLKQVGAASMSCCVNESDYLTNDQNDLTDLKNVVGVSLLVVNKATIISFIGQSLETTKQQPGPLHLVIRNLCGKYSWDISLIDFELSQRNEKDSIVLDPDTFQQEDSRTSMKYDSDFNEDGTSSSSISSRSSTSRDHIGDLMNQLNSLITNGSSTLSCQNAYKKRNVAQSISNPRCKIAQSEETMIALLTNQRFQELNYCERSNDLDRVVLHPGPKYTKQQIQPNLAEQNDAKRTKISHQLSFEQCRLLIQQFGYLTWEKRCKVESLAKSARLLRELKNLDAQPSRETHKIAVIYVANGQEDKNSILTNSSGSRAFEEFVSGLGWEVNLASHLGFKGGLQSNKSTGETSPYYCNSTTEVMFHVSTRIPITGPADDESLNRKLRHLGNDEIHIVWSEHSRDYRRGIIPTEFGDVIIAIYPMLTYQGYYRIQISSKQDVPMFGPLFDNFIVHQTSLAALVRATAINASRAKRLKLPYFKSHFEERGRLIDTIVQNHTEKLSFEDFAVKFYQTNGAAVQEGVPISGLSDGIC